AAGVVAKLRAGKSDARGMRGDCVRSGAVAPVPQDPVPLADLFRLDALERHGEALASRLVLQVDPDVECVDAADDDAELVAAFDDVRVDEARARDLNST